MIGFIVAAGIGVVLLLASLLFDGVLDALDIDFLGNGVFSGASIGGLITGIGCGGAIGMSMGWGLILSVVLGAALGVGVAAVAVALYRVLKKTEAAQEEFSLDRLVGTTGVVTAAPKLDARGLVRVEYLGSPRTVSFSSDLPLVAGDSVVVTEVLGPDSVNVIPSQPVFGRTLE